MRNNIGEKIFFLAIFFSCFNTLSLPSIYFTLADGLFVLALFFVIVNKKKSPVKTLNEPFDQALLLSREMYIVWFFAWILLLVGYLLSLFFSMNQETLGTITIVIQYFFIMVIVFYIFLNVVNPNNYMKLLKAYINGFISIIIIGMFFETFLPSLYLTLNAKGIFIGTVRFGSFLGSNGLSKLAATIIPIIFFLLYNNAITRKRFGFYLIILIVGSLKAASNGGFLALFFSLVLTLLSLEGIKKKMRIIFLSLFVLIIIWSLTYFGFLNFSVFTNRVLNNISSSSDLDDAGSFTMKIDMMKDALSHIVSNPILGLGANGYLRINPWGQTVHNSYLLIWVEGGIFSFIGLLTLLLLPLKILKSKLSRFDKMNIKFFSIFLFIFMINIFTGNHIYQRFRLLLIILFYFAVCYKSIEKGLGRGEAL